MSGIDDQRMKDLAKRIVAMSPEPPPYPEEVTVTQPRSSKPSPVLIFAGAAVIVLILAAIPILLVGGGGEVDPIATTTTSTVPTSEDSEPAVTTTVESTTTTEPATTTTTPVVNTSEVVLFLVATPENSFTGNPALVPFRTATVSGDEASLVDDSVRALANPDIVLPEGFMNMVPAGIEVLSSEMRPEEHMVVLDLNQAFLAGAGGLLADFTMLNQLVYTVTHLGPFDAVLFTVDGEPVTAFGSEGLDLSQPVGKDAFLDQVNSILLTAPVEGQTGAPLTVTGVANVFEATVSLEILDPSGTVVLEQFTTATCGTGCWGEFTFEVEYAFTGPGTVRVFWSSPEDGAPADVVTVPLLFDSEVGWELIPLN